MISSISFVQELAGSRGYCFSFPQVPSSLTHHKLTLREVSGELLRARRINFYPVIGSNFPQERFHPFLSVQELAGSRGACLSFPQVPSRLTHHHSTLREVS
jgi:hypothetical protein